MKPRVFISSTYYDLKHVRERLEMFIESYSFEPVLFESDSVIFEQNKPLDISCYNEVKLCHMMILIIGGRYGSSISGTNQDEKKMAYNNEYVSITRKEYETALRKNIPIFIFIDKNVYSEYQTYKKNKLLFDKQNINESFAFAHVDDINVFKFIGSIHNNAIKSFEKVEEIENYLESQIAGMLYLYLDQLQNNKKDSKILDAVSELQNVTEQMNAMLQAVGKNVIQDQSYENVIFHQNELLIDFFVSFFSNNISFKTTFTSEEADRLAPEIYRICNKTILNHERLTEISNYPDWREGYEKSKELQDEFYNSLKVLNINLIIGRFNYTEITKHYMDKIYPIISQNERLKHFMDQKMISAISFDIGDLPF